MAKISVAAIGMNPVDRKLLKSLFLLSDQNQFGFELVEGEQAQLVVADIDGVDDATLQAFKNEHPGQPVLHISVSGGYRPGADPHITKPLKVNAVFEELNKLTVNGSKARVADSKARPATVSSAPAQKKPAQVSTAASSDAPTFDPNDYLIGLLRQIIARKQDSVITIENVGSITVSASQCQYLTSLSNGDLLDLFRQPASSFVVTPAEPADIAALTNSDEKRSLTDLMWGAAYYAADGRLPAGSLRNDVVTLEHWPNLTRLPISENTISICALLSRYPTSITLATRMLKLKPEEMYTFYSAAKLSGAARATNRAAGSDQEPEVIEPKVSKGLLGKLLTKVKGL